MHRQLGQAALSLIGTPFRLHGRDAKTGLDCVGLVAEALRKIGREPKAPAGYTMRSADAGPLLHFAAANALEAVPSGGDIVLVSIHALQQHLLIAAPGGWVHAHAGLGRVAFLPQPLSWPVLQHWRLFDALVDPGTPHQTRI